MNYLGEMTGGGRNDRGRLSGDWHASLGGIGRARGIHGNPQALIYPWTKVHHVA
jgi:hypothetical protein